MATTRISALTELTNPASTDVLVINDVSVSSTKKIQLSNLIPDDAIDSEHYVAGSIDNEHLANDAVDSDELASGAVDIAHLSATGTPGTDFLRGDNTWATPTDTNTMGSGFTVSATTDSNATTITQGDDLMFTAGTGITCETTADGTVTITNTVSGASTATSSATGLIKIEDDTDQSVAAESVSTTANRTYGLQLNSSDQGVVNVPWTDTNTVFDPDGAQVFNESGADVDFRVEGSGKDSALFVQGSDGSVGIGTGSPTQPLHVSGNIYTTGYLNTAGSGTAGGVQFADGNLYMYRATNDLAVKLQGAEKLRILSGGGLTFNGDTATANALDDYEEGTWTPTLTDTAGNVASTSSTAGSYTKIGRLVCVQAWLADIDTTGLADNPIRLHLPFTPKNEQAQYSAQGTARLDGIDFPAGTVNVSVGARPNVAYLLMYEARDNDTDTNTTVSDIASGTADIFYSILYAT